MVKLMRRILVTIVMSLFLITSIGSATSANVASAAKNHPIAGCPPAKHRGPWKVPADGGKAVRIVTGPYILHVWFNNGNPSVVDEPWNEGPPPWDQDLIKVKIPGGVKIALYGAGGEGWDYVNNRACRHNLRFEFRHGKNIPVKSIDTLVAYGLAKRLN